MLGCAIALKLRGDTASWQGVGTGRLQPGLGGGGDETHNPGVWGNGWSLCAETRVSSSWQDSHPIRIALFH